MLSKSDLTRHARALYDYTPYPAVRYNILRMLGTPEEDPLLAELRREFLHSDIVEEMFETQDKNGGWGCLRTKDYSVKAKIPTSATGIERCLYIGLTLDDRDILFDAKEYLESFLLGTSREPVFEKNERAVPWQKATVCDLLEAVEATVGGHNPLCGETCEKWLYIANRAYESGEYSYEKDRAVQHEVFFTHEDRLVPMQSGLILKRRENVSPELEAAMLHHLGGNAALHGHFWDKIPSVLPGKFQTDKTRRWFATFNYINQFRGSGEYLSGAVEWLMENARGDGLWDWGPQVKDPWGYFGYFSCSRKYAHNRVVDCTMEVLRFLQRYLENNENGMT